MGVTEVPEHISLCLCFICALRKRLALGRHFRLRKLPSFCCCGSCAPAQQRSLLREGGHAMTGSMGPRPSFLLSCSHGATAVRAEPKGKFAPVKDMPNYSEIIVIACLLAVSSSPCCERSCCLGTAALQRQCLPSEQGSRIQWKRARCCGEMFPLPARHGGSWAALYMPGFICDPRSNLNHLQ